MKQDLYEVLWQVETHSHSFLYREFRAFCSESEAKRYGMKYEAELNGGVSIEERAQDGYYFKYHSASKVREIDGFVVKLGLKRPLKER